MLFCVDRDLAYRVRNLYLYCRELDRLYDHLDLSVAMKDGRTGLGAER